MLAWCNSSQVGECCDKANCSVPTHSKKPNIVKEDHPCRRAWIEGFAEKRANDDLRPTRLTYHAGAEVIEFAL